MKLRVVVLKLRSGNAQISTMDSGVSRSVNLCGEGHGQWSTTGEISQGMEARIYGREVSLSAACVSNAC